VITNRRKGLNTRKMVASSAIGSPSLYEFINDNPAIEFHPSDVVNRPDIIAAHNKMVSLSVAMAMDLTGQVAADALEFNNFSGVTGMLDFIRGAFSPRGGEASSCCRPLPGVESIAASSPCWATPPSWCRGRMSITSPPNSVS
jgi:acyl-CoA hydrolase